MSKMIQIRNVPDDIHATLKSRAAKAGMSLSDYLTVELARIAELPTIEEISERIRAMEPVDQSIDSATIIRRARDAA